MKIVCIYKSFIYVGLCEDRVSYHIMCWKKYKVLGVREGEEERKGEMGWL